MRNSEPQHLHGDFAEPALLGIEWQHGDTVGIDAAEIGLGHDVGGDLDDVSGHAPGAQHRADLRVDGVGGNARRGHAAGCVRHGSQVSGRGLR